MLIYRIITALILIPLVLLGIFYLTPVPMALISSALFLLAGWEWAGLVGMIEKSKRIGYLLILFVEMFFLIWIPTWVVLGTASVVWLIMLYYLFHPDKFADNWKASQAWQAPLGIWILGSSWYALNIIYNLPFGKYYFLLMLLFIWSADIGAYFVGRLWGKHKLAPHISPGKSIEGAIGGMMTALMVAAICGHFFYIALDIHYLNLMCLAFVTSWVSILGDLSESLIKRQAGVKDSGNLLPGHGGLLDRIDSLLSVAPIFAVLLLLLLAFSLV